MNANLLKRLVSLIVILGMVINCQAQMPEQEISHLSTSKKVKTSAGFLGPVIHKVKYAAELNTQNLEHGLSSYYIDFNLSNYFGDLCRGGNCTSFRPGFGTGYSYRWDRRISFRTEFNYYRLFSKDNYEARNFTFRSDNMELYAGVSYDIVPFSVKYKYRHTFIPYVFGGFGVTHFNPKGKYQGRWYELAPLHTEGKSYSRWSPIIPFGLGVRIKIFSGVDLLTEVGFRKTFTDYLDDVSSHEWQPVNSFSNPVAAALSNQTGIGDSYRMYRGNPHKKDMYAIYQLKVVYTPKGKFFMKQMK
jgi:hypothetical protein